MLARFLWVVFYTALGLAVLAFMAMNRASVSVRIPFIDAWDMPLFGALTAMFMLGLMIGLSFATMQWISYTRRIRRQARAIEQLEKELAQRSGS